MSTSDVSAVSVRAARADDVASIRDVLRSNRDETSLAQQPEAVIRRNLRDFLVACDDGGRLLGCTQVHVHRPGFVEILAVAVRPEAQGRGVGGALMRRAVEVARAHRPHLLWLSTEKPDYFARFGFSPFSRWEIPIPILLVKLRILLRQQVGRWIPALFYRTVFMRYTPPPGEPESPDH